MPRKNMLEFTRELQAAFPWQSRNFPQYFKIDIDKMQCERLIKLVKSWYVSVREETMAPARMVSFIEKHVATCSVCQEDPDIKDEVAKITEIILPEAKLAKSIRQPEDFDDSFEDDDLPTDDEEVVSNDDDEVEEAEVFEEEFDDDFVEEPDLLDDEV
jgi:hypothetical protein